MSAGPHSRTPDGARLVRDLEALLDGFEYTDLAYLTPRGVWSKSPACLRDRIANELIFRLWQARGKPDWPQAAMHLFAPLVAEPEVWTTAARLPAPGVAPEVCSRNLLAALEMLFALVEYQVDITNARAYVADWDFTGKARRGFYSEEAGRVLERLGGVSGAIDDRLVEIGNALRHCEKTVLEKTVETVAKEEAVRWETSGWLVQTGDRECGGGTDTALAEGPTRDIPFSASMSDSLIRPCIEVLLRKDLDVSSGVQFQASDLLGRMKDPRAVGGMLRALDSFDPRHTGIRANLIYALGNLKEKRCFRRFAKALEYPDSITVRTPGGVRYKQPLQAEKCEAIWALGKLGADAAEAIPGLVARTDSQDLDIRLHLAWALGTIALGQRQRTGGIDSDVVIALMRLIRQGDGTLFEEAASGLKELGLPDFLHTLYLHDFSTLPVLSLKPSSTGLYELSETILHLSSVKRPVVMAVTGDSGTGKTYFCEAIAGGFSDLRAGEIVYLKRDRIGDRTLDRMVGFKWLRSHVEPRFYDPYPVPEDLDDPDAYFDEFIRANGDKKLIVLDGWRDQAYFNRVIELFYEKGYLDLLVHFRTTFSTRRLNLEEREASLERVKIHLPLVEEPVIEETSFYREGAVLVYNLDNSIPSRLDNAGIREVFNRRKVDGWADRIRIGRFAVDRRPLDAETRVLVPVDEEVEPGREVLKPGAVMALRVYESPFTRALNDNLKTRPHLLETVTAGDIPIHRIVFHTQGQLAFSGCDGTVGVLIGFNDRVFYARPHRSAVRGLAVKGREIYTIGDDGYLKVLSFEQSTVTELGSMDSPAVALAGHREGRLATGHRDGSVRVWDAEAGWVTALALHEGPVESVAMDRRGRVYSGGRDGRVCILNKDMSSVRTVTIPGVSVAVLAPYVDGRLVVATRPDDTPDAGRGPAGAETLILDPLTGRCLGLRIAEARSLSAMSVYFDGRLVVAFRSWGEPGLQSGIAVVDPGPDDPAYTVLGGHAAETRDCLSMGPRIISCGSEAESEHTLKIWGTASYVAAEHSKAGFLPPSMPKPPYYRSLF